jgi:site-specific recombinase XerD
VAKELPNSFALANEQILEKNEKLSLKSKRRLTKSKSDNTLKAYLADWNDFHYWCQMQKVTSLPAAPETVVNYINDLADHAAANTVSRRLSAISENHRAAGFVNDNPILSPLVKASIAAIKREKGIFQSPKQPILLEDLALLEPHFAPFGLTGIRDKALLFLGFSGAFRRSELVALQYDDLTFSQEGVMIRIKRSKGDQEGVGEQIAIPYRQNADLCAVAALEKWLNHALIKSGPIFRPISKTKKVGISQLSDKSVALIVKKYTALAGLNPKQFAGHSLRRGFATSAAQHDVAERQIMKQTRHKSEKMVRRYIQEGNLFKENALNKMF